ncbi:hypothetical protein XELAEV_18029629mg [Xenopus laevis]|uniref:Uncharacterized protein n=1 Tax=Xenopus laevis TaxID=8355 RepID=A0A974HI93_XENLA|nr:hypothetical protein XELAEV_18029629mg [Xenopus laevis]
MAVKQPYFNRFSNSKNYSEYLLYKLCSILWYDFYHNNVLLLLLLYSLVFSHVLNSLPSLPDYQRTEQVRHLKMIHAFLLYWGLNG